MYARILLLILFTVSSSYAQDVPGFVRDSLDAYIETGRSDWKIPAVAVGIVKNGKVVFLKGYGLRNADSTQARTDENTLFMIGSNTKAFTATALAMLDASGKLSLTDRVTKFLPEFQQYYDCTLRQITLTDLLCHRVGLRTFEGDFMYWTSTLSRADVIKKFGQLKPPLGFRTRFGYCNAGFLTAGEVLPVVTKKSWETFVQDSLLTPLGMVRSLPLSAQITKASNAATGYTRVENKLVKVAYPAIDNLAAAGSISASVKDLTRWLLMQLDTGRIDGKRIVSKEAILKTWAGQTIISSGGKSVLPTHLSMYGLGWFIKDFNGKLLLEHDGGVDGFVTTTAFLPEEQLGIVVLTNSDAHSFQAALKYQIIEAFLGKSTKNYHNVFFDYDKKDQATEAARLAKEREQVAKKIPAFLPISDYAGRYVHPVYGYADVKEKNGKLSIHFEHHPNLTATLEAQGANSFLAAYSIVTFGEHPVVFQVQNRRIKSVKVKVSDFVEYGDYEFERK